MQSTNELNLLLIQLIFIMEVHKIVTLSMQLSAALTNMFHVVKKYIRYVDFLFVYMVFLDYNNQKYNHKTERQSNK